MTTGAQTSVEAGARAPVESNVSADAVIIKAQDRDERFAQANE